MMVMILTKLPAITTCKLVNDELGESLNVSVFVSLSELSELPRNFRPPSILMTRAMSKRP